MSEDDKELSRSMRGAKRATLPGAKLGDFVKDIDLVDIAKQVRDMSHAAKVDLSLRVQEDVASRSSIVSLMVAYQALNSHSPVRIGTVTKYVGAISQTFFRISLRQVLDEEVGDLALSAVPAIMLDRLIDMLESEPTSPSQATARDQ